MKYIQFIILFLSLLVFQYSCKKESTAPSGYDQEILDAMNAYRATLGLSSMEMDPYLWQLAHEHSKNIADGTISFGHDGITERSELISKELGMGNIAENIAWGSGTGTELINKWIASIGHKSNIEGNFAFTGISAVKAKDGNYYYTQIFYKQY